MIKPGSCEAGLLIWRKTVQRILRYVADLVETFLVEFPHVVSLL